MGWNYGRDKEVLAKAATKDAMNACEKYSAYMQLASANYGGKEDMKHAAEFFEICKKSICRELDEKVRVLKERANNVK